MAPRQLAAVDPIAASASAIACDCCGQEGVWLCSMLADGTTVRQNRTTRAVYLAAGQTFAWKGKLSPVIGTLSHGLLKIVKRSEGREHTLGTLIAGDIFNRRDSGLVVAVTTSRLCLMDRLQFDHLARTDPELARTLLLRASGDVDRVKQWTSLLADKSPEQRIASLLLRLATQTDIRASTRLPISREQIADLLGLTADAVSWQLSKLRADGLIALTDPRHFQIEQPDQLIRRAA